MSTVPEATLALAARVAGAAAPEVAYDEVHRRLTAALEGRAVGGWDVDCTAHTVATAAGEARERGLDITTTARALSIAATQAVGLRAVAGSWLGDYQLAEAGDRGREAARLAESGLTAPTSGLEGRRGLLALMAPDVPASVLIPEGDRA